MTKVKYRDYIIDYQHAGRNFYATITAPHPLGVIAEPELRATEDEGENAILARARARIDRDIVELYATRMSN